MGETKVSPLSLLPSAGSWCLADDDSLLLAMQELSLTISSQTKQLLDKMDQLAINAASAQTRLQTTTNNFMLLSNIKFIEARVYEDSDVDNKSEEIKEDQEETLNEDISTTQALKYGFDVIQSAFEKIEINDSDSDSEVEEEKVISVLQPKNPYHVRSLPAVIGTQAWLDDDKIGLVEEETEDKTDTSESESEEEVAVPKKEESEYSDSENEITKPRTIPEAAESDSISDFSDDEELFKPKINDVENKPKFKTTRDDSVVENHDVEINDEPDDVKSNTKTFASELSSKLGLGSSKLDQENTDNDQDTSDEENNAPPKPRKSVKLPPKKSVLFDSSDSEDDLFSPKPKLGLPKIQTKAKAPESEEQTTIKPSKKSPPLPPSSSSKPGSDLKGNIMSSNPIIPTIASNNKDPVVESHSDEDFFSTISSKVAQKKSVEVNVGIKDKQPPSKSLFGDSSDDDDDIFSDIKVNNRLKSDTMPNELSTAKKSLFDNSDDSDDLFADLLSKTKVPDPPKNEEKIEKKKPFGGTPMFGGMSSSLLPNKHYNENNADPSISEGNSTSDDDIFSPNGITTKEPEAPQTDQEEAKKSLGLKAGGVSTSMLIEKADNDQPIQVDHSTEASNFDGKTSTDEEDDIFSPESRKIKPPLPPSSASKPKQEMDKEQDNTSVTVKKPFGGTPMFGGMAPAMLTDKVMNESEPKRDRESMQSTDNGDFFYFAKNENAPLSTDSKPMQKSDSEKEASPMIEHESVNNEKLHSNNPNNPSLFFDSKKGLNSEQQDERKEEKETTSLPPIPPASTKPKTSDIIESQQSNDEQKEMLAQTVKPKKPIGGVSMFGGFNPKHLLKNDGEEEALDVKRVKTSSDDTVDSKEPDQQSTTLNILTKSRPKMNKGRRPPTRAGRKTAVESSNAFSFDITDVPSRQVDNKSSLGLEEKDTKANVEGGSLLSGFSPSEMITPTIIAGKKDLDLINATKSEILIGEENNEASVEVPAQIITKSPDLPSSTSSMSQETFEPPPMSIIDKKQDKTKNLFGFDDSDSDDDMFSNIKNDNTVRNNDPISNIFGDDSDDDLFSSLTFKK